MQLTWKKYLNKYFMKPISAKNKNKNTMKGYVSLTARKIKIKIIVKC